MSKVVLVAQPREQSVALNVKIPVSLVGRFRELSADHLPSLPDVQSGSPRALRYCIKG